MVTVVTFLVSTHPQNCPAALLPPYDHRYRRRILPIAPAAPQPPPPRSFRLTTTGSATPTAAAAPLLTYDHRNHHRILDIAPAAPQPLPPRR